MSKEVNEPGLHIEHRQIILSRYFDNPQDVEIARILLKGKYDWVKFATILDVGGLPIQMQLREIKRNIKRIRSKLDLARVRNSEQVKKRKKAA